MKRIGNVTVPHITMSPKWTGEGGDDPEIGHTKQIAQVPTVDLDDVGPSESVGRHGVEVSKDNPKRGQA